MSAFPLPAWRSLLFVPATAERFVAKAHTRGADAIILDLEDSIPPAAKSAARAALPDAVRRVGQGGADVVVRINRPLELAVADIAAAVMPGVAALMLPKLSGREHVRLLSEVVAAREAAAGMAAGATRFIGLVETADALPHLFAIAADPRMVALGVGAEDLATEFGGSPSADSMYVWAMHCLAAARAAGILPMGSLGNLARLDDLPGYRSGLQRARALGFGTAACIHPAHVPIINEEYGASPEQIDRARRLVAAFEEGVARGLGAVAFEGAMIDLPVVDRARRLLARATEWERRDAARQPGA
jgi:citrate lyase subunit beta/citryl-CoA lyase